MSEAFLISLLHIINNTEDNNMKTKVGSYSKLADKYGKRITKVYYRFKNYSTNTKPHQGAKECQRRVAQGMNGMCYVHGSQYPSI